jgi:acylphosphatase
MNDSEAMTDKIFHCNLHFSGHVQGVGFRYQVLQIAKEFEVSGMVRNLLDGRVQLEAEGAEEEVRGFAKEVENRLDMYIRKVERTEGNRSQKYRGFTIC